MSVQFGRRLVLAGAVVTAVTASLGVAVTFPVARPAAPPALPPPVAASSPPSSASPGPPAPSQARTVAELAPPRNRPAPGSGGLSEADWARLPAGLRERVRDACRTGELTGPHCTHA